MEDGSALVTVPITISLDEFDEVPLLSTWRSQSTNSTTTRRSLSLVRCGSRCRFRCIMQHGCITGAGADVLVANDPRPSFHGGHYS